MSHEPITYFNRSTGRVETEQVYGEAFMHWTYGTRLGAVALHALAKRSLFSRWYGWRMNRPASRKKVLPFIRQFQVDAQEFADPPDAFRSFNEFFYRKLKPSARPIAPDPDVPVFPADGRHFGFQDISRWEGVFVKGQFFDLRKLVRDEELAERYRDGTMVLSRLCPVDYHRFHFPTAGVPDRAVLINGPLYSVNPIALRRNIHIFTENKRAYCRLQSPEFGQVLMLEIGATNVGSFDYTYTPGRPVVKGEEKGFFKFGGSSMITLFERDRLRLDEDLVENSRLGRELYARMGDHLGRTCGRNSSATM